MHNEVPEKRAGVSGKFVSSNRSVAASSPTHSLTCARNTLGRLTRNISCELRGGVLLGTLKMGARTCVMSTSWG